MTENYMNSVLVQIKKYHTIILLVLIILLGTVLSFYDIGAESLWTDEAASLHESQMSIQQAASSNNQPPLYFLLLRFWISVFGESEIALRSLSALFGIAFIFVIFLTGKALFNHKVGLIAAFISSFSCYRIYESQEVRGYALLLLLSLLSYLFLIKFLQENSRKYYFPYIFCSLLMIYAHLFGLLIIASEIIYLIIFYKRFKAHKSMFILAYIIIIILSVPVLFLLKNNICEIASDGFWISKPGFIDFLYTLGAFSAYGHFKELIFLMFIILAGIGLLASKRFLKKQKPESGITFKIKGYYIIFDKTERIGLLLIWLLVPILIVFIQSQIMTPLYQTKYLIGTMPAWLLLISIGLNNIYIRKIRYFVLIIIFILSLIGLLEYYNNNVKHEWREAANFINQNACENDIILIYPHYTQKPFDYYYEGTNTQISIQSADDSLIPTIHSQTDKDNNFWLVINTLSGVDYNDIHKRIINNFGEESIINRTDFLQIIILQIDP
jgi:mannosyltransferase